MRKENYSYVSMQGNDTHPPPFSSKQTVSEWLVEPQLPKDGYD